MELQFRAGPAWRQAIERGDLGVWDLRPLQETVHHSPRWKERFGFPRLHEADSTDFWRCRVHPDDLEAMLEAMRAHGAGDTPTYEARFRLRSNGSGYRLLQSRGRVVERDDAGRVSRMVGTMIDLTERPCTPRGGLVDEVPLADTAPSGGRPFHLLLTAPEPTADVAVAEANERLVASVLDLLEEACRQLQDLESRGAGAAG
ncbi:PAS domain-containing protein [Piscinibacter gummiphilus]|uniref:histidine kinase n=1 Tax=Piscinibacter gummiphilus TaxID=946333 RepID=A0A1W6LAJ7_9BURK|nr:PAS domain-containing protein [Piscinibacter gummiphilus]ARN21244.1 hypothetical protein A4W93_15805 [Piscinibacter gummiphilus]GLS93807.1 hypothetical protein GCM10007918_10980 [Piscinibacter gummiphilus]